MEPACPMKQFFTTFRRRCQARADLEGPLDIAE